MTVPKEYLAWAPSGSPWSPWVKPVLFSFLQGRAPSPVTWKSPRDPADGSPAPRPGQRGTALVVDTPDALDFAPWLASRGFRPVPLHNACPGANALLDMWPAVDRLREGAGLLLADALPDDAPPAFLLDSRRALGVGTASPGKFDNRWIAMPQDFPSGTFLQSRGIDTVVVVSEHGPAEDLLHVLLPWRKAGLRVLGARELGAEPSELQLRLPSRFGSMLYRFLAQMGFKRNSVGGFGALIPEPMSDGNGGGSWGGLS